MDKNAECPLSSIFTPKRGMNRHFQAKQAKYSNFCIYQNYCSNFNHSDKVLFMGGPKMSLTYPR